MPNGSWSRVTSKNRRKAVFKEVKVVPGPIDFQISSEGQESIPTRTCRQKEKRSPFGSKILSTACFSFHGNFIIILRTTPSHSITSLASRKRVSDCYGLMYWLIRQMKRATGMSWLRDHGIDPSSPFNLWHSTTNERKPREGCIELKFSCLGFHCEAPSKFVQQSD